MVSKLKQGYADLLDAQVDLFDQPGLHIVETTKRNRPEWANWVQPIWFLAINNSIICSVSPNYAATVREITAKLTIDSLLAAELLTLVQPMTAAHETVGLEWVQCELLCYLHPEPPAVPADDSLELLQPIDEKSRYFLRNFDGGGYCIRASDGTIAAHACIKNKGLLHEIAVGTEADYRQRGLGKAVVAAAVRQILKQGKVPVYWPDSVKNRASYKLAYAVGFQKVGEMLFCCYAEADWAGFPVDHH